MAIHNYTPRPVLDTFKEIIDQYKAVYEQNNPRQFIRQWLNHCFAGLNISLLSEASKDYQLVLNFLYNYRGSSATFSAYRRDLERLLQWSWFVREQSILKHKRNDIEAFIEFCIKPYKRWIGLKTVARFKLSQGQKTPNSEWRPFNVNISKKDFGKGKKPNKDQYQLSQATLKVIFGILGSFYKYLQQEEIIQANPVALIRQKSKFIRKNTSTPMIRRLSTKQWNTLFTVTQEMADQDEKHERTLFILSCLYGMYLRISELVASDRWVPSMGDFFKDNDGNWWFKTVGKGNKARQIAVSNTMLKALKRYREHLNLSSYPTVNEKTPLISHINNNQPLTSVRRIRLLIQNCFNKAINRLESENEKSEANSLRLATVHWLRHTGISDDVKIRPREHVRDDAGHSSGAITDRYIDVELQERARSARKKVFYQNNQKN